MSIGNLKTDGGKGTNWPWQYRMLKGLEGIINAINTTSEAQEYEAKVVNINCTGDPFTGDRLYLEVRVFDTDLAPAATVPEAMVSIKAGVTTTASVLSLIVSLKPFISSVLATTKVVLASISVFIAKIACNVASVASPASK